MTSDIQRVREIVRRHLIASTEVPEAGYGHDAIVDAVMEAIAQARPILDQRAADAEQLLKLLKYYGDGSRWFRRTDGKKPNWLVLAIEDFEAKHGEIHEAEDAEVKPLHDRWWNGPRPD